MAQVQVDYSSALLVEGGPGLSITVTLIEEPGDPVVPDHSVSWTIGFFSPTITPSDYDTGSFVAQGTALNFTGYGPAHAQTFSEVITWLDDGVPEGAETFTVTLNQLTGTNVSFAPGTPPVAFITVLDNTAPTITSSATANVAENQISAINVQSTDDVDSEGAGLTYSLSGGADQSLFSIDATTGVVTFNTAPNFEAPGDANGDNDYDVQVTVTDAGGLTDVQDLTISVTDEVEAPTITSSATANVAENQTSAIDVQSTDDSDAEGAGLTYRLSGGADQSLFSIDATTGVLTFNVAPNFEAPGDANGDNDYDVQVTVTDAGGLTDVQDLTISVTDEVEAPTITSSATASVLENQTSAIDVQSTDDSDAEGAGLIYSLSGGADQSLFSIDATTGVVTFNTAPNFEAPGDANGDNDYDVQVTVTDAGGLTDVQDLVVTVTNDVAEALPPTFGPSLELSDLNGSNGFVINGIAGGDRSGDSVSNAGDINGDGIDDLIIGAPFADPNDTNRAGASYVVFGSDQGFGPSLELSALDGSNGFVLNGIDERDISGTSVSGAGDVNGDGIDDLIIGASGADPNGDSSGQSYVVFGTDQGFGASLELSALDGSNGFVLNGIARLNRSGISVSSAGDVNGDGIDDLIIGTIVIDPNGRLPGESYVVFGSDQGFGASLELSALDGTNGFVLNGIDGGDSSGGSVSSAGDINGDGIDDLIIGAQEADPNGGYSGESYVVFGTDQGFGASLELSALDGSNGFVLNGIKGDDLSGGSVSGAGDINGDGIDDLIIGADLADPNGNTAAGESYVVFGSDQGFGASLELSALDGTNGFVLNGIDAIDISGGSVSGAGDVNGDGIDDLIIGADSADPNGIYSGESYVVFGTDQGFGASLELSALDGSNGFVLNGIDSRDYSGTSVSGAGDVNGDGIDDLIIGATGADPNGNSGAGESYVVFGRSSNLAPTLTTATPVEVPENTTAVLDVNATDDSDSEGAGLTYNLSGGADQSLFSIDASTGVLTFNTAPDFEAPGDANGDNDYDVQVTVTDSSGLTDVQDLTISVTNVAEGLFTEGDDTVDFNAVDPADYEFDALGGNDTVILPDGGLGQLFSGGAGNDTITGSNANDIINGNDGDDDIRGGRGNDIINTGQGNNIVRGGGGDDQIVGLGGNDRLIGGGGDDEIIGGAGNDTITGGDGDDILTGGVGADIFRFDDRDHNNNGGVTPTDVITDFEFGVDTATFRFDGRFFEGSGITTINNNQAAFSTVEEFNLFLGQVEAKGGSVSEQNGGVLAEVLNPANNRTLNYLFVGAELPVT